MSRKAKAINTATDTPATTPSNTAADTPATTPSNTAADTPATTPSNTAADAQGYRISYTFAVATPTPTKTKKTKNEVAEPPAPKISKSVAVANACITNAEIDKNTAGAVAYAASGKIREQAAMMAGYSTLPELLEKEVLSGAEWQILATTICSKDRDILTAFNSLREGGEKIKPAIYCAISRVIDSLKNLKPMKPAEWTKLGKLSNWLGALDKIIAIELSCEDTMLAIESQRLAEESYISEALAETLGI